MMKLVAVVVALLLVLGDTTTLGNDVVGKKKSRRGGVKEYSDVARGVRNLKGKKNKRSTDKSMDRGTKLTMGTTKSSTGSNKSGTKSNTSTKATSKSGSNSGRQPTTTGSPTTGMPSAAPSPLPTTIQPTQNPTEAPSTEHPTSSPTAAPSTEPPTGCPTAAPSTDPPTGSPTAAPSTEPPTKDPTLAPTAFPTPEFCSCSPGRYEFQFDFSLECDSFDAAGPGITGTACVEDPPGEPVSVASIQFLELSTELDVLSQTVMPGPFQNGETLSLAVQKFLDGETIGGLQARITGENALGETIILQWVIIFSSECNVYPVLSAGTNLSWFTLIGVGPPPAALCPMAGTDSPTGSPTFALTPMPTPEPSPAPTSSPPTGSPTSSSCACSPVIYEFSLDFSNECDPPTVHEDIDGLESSECIVEPDDVPPPTDLVPVVITRLRITEGLDSGGTIDHDLENLQVVSGDSFTFTPVSLANGVILSWLSIEFFAENSAGENIYLYWLLEFNNDCDIYPVLEGLRYGWAVVTLLVHPSPDTCPGVETLPTPVPTETPPTPLPTSSPCPDTIRVSVTFVMELAIGVQPTTREEELLVEVLLLHLIGVVKQNYDGLDEDGTVGFANDAEFVDNPSPPDTLTLKMEIAFPFAPLCAPSVLQDVISLLSITMNLAADADFFALLRAISDQPLSYPFFTAATAQFVVTDAEYGEPP